MYTVGYVENCGFVTSGSCLVALPVREACIRLWMIAWQQKPRTADSAKQWFPCTHSTMHPAPLGLGLGLGLFVSE